MGVYGEVYEKLYFWNSYFKKKSGTILCSLILYGQGGFFNGKNIFKY